MTTWVDALETSAPDIVAAWSGIEEGNQFTVRREVRRRAGEGSAERIVQQLDSLASAMTAIVERLSDEDLARDGGEEGWNVAQAIGHACDARAGLSLAAAKAAAGRWPQDATGVAPGVPGPSDADRAALLHAIARSQRIIERSARTVAGHETDPCPLDHPLVGQLRCGEWLVFAGVHDLMHLEQLHAIMRR
jgi:uncharacterized damage-inducible protein DinB